MLRQMRENRGVAFRTLLRPEPVAIFTISSWEATALLTGMIPTVTSQVMRLPRPARAVLCLLVGAWMVHHFDVAG